MLAAFIVIIIIFGIFFFYILRFLLAYLAPAILHYNHSYDFANLLSFSKKSRLTAARLPLTRYFHFTSLCFNVSMPYSFASPITILFFDNNSYYFDTYFKIHIFCFNSCYHFVFYTFDSNVNLANSSVLSTFSTNGASYDNNSYFISRNNSKVFFIINSKIFLTNFLTSYGRGG